MRFFKRIRVPRIGTKLMLLGALLMIIPFLSYRQLVEMERLLIQGQSNAQMLTAKGIATLFNGRDDLFNDLPISTADYEPLFAHSLEDPVRIDGRLDDWGDGLLHSFITFGSQAGGEDGDLALLLGERGGQLYGFVQIDDPERIYRDPEVLRLDNADQLRLNFMRTDGEDGRILLIGQREGSLTAYEMDEDWRFAATGRPDKRVAAAVVETPNGFDFEFRMPLDMLGSGRFFGLAYADVDDPVSRAIGNITQTLPTAGKKSFDLVVLRSPEVRNIIEGLGFAGARILVIDQNERVRAETGARLEENVPEGAEGWFATVRGWFESIRPLLHQITLGEAYEPFQRSLAESEAVAQAVITSSLEGDPIAKRRSLVEALEIIMAAHPIYSKDSIIGTVVVEQPIDEILTFQRSALEQVVLVSVVSLIVVVLALIAFAGRLAWRIRNLRREASAAIDQYGRLRNPTLRAEVTAGDEIGDLARAVSSMLSKLHQHNTFLESMPRTLRHEINNPLNTLSTSLDNLALEIPSVQDSKYLESAKRGVLRIGSIVQNLADAANLDEALQSEEFEIIDMSALLESYVANCKITHPECDFIFRGPGRPTLTRVADYRIEQMLDKIIDNAIDFHRHNSPIKVQLDTYRDHLQITVANRGPVLPERAERSLFDSMVSHRGPNNRLHFGLGLYVVRVIAEHHDGFVRAMNLTDGSGVAILVQLPLAKEHHNVVDTPARGMPAIASGG